VGPLDGFTVEPLASKHDCERFSGGDDEGAHAFNKYLKTQARKQGENSTTRVHIYANDAGIIGGFYALSLLAVTVLPPEMQRGGPRMDVPATLLGKLARRTNFKGFGVGEFLLNHAIKNTVLSSRIVASAMLVIDAKPTAIDWYLKQPIEFERMRRSAAPAPAVGFRPLATDKVRS
jgi:hypothetical protein